jgi:hypothetical protein
MAKELSQNEELGLDESTLLRILEAKTDKVIQTAAANRFTFDDAAGAEMNSI